MIVLDEQLLGYGLQQSIRRWYRGSVVDVIQLRPGTLIPDDAIPQLLRRAKKPTFVTINVEDFWRRSAPDARYAIVCFSLSHREVTEISQLLRRLLSVEPFRTRQSRLGKIARVNHEQVRYYSTESWAIRTVNWTSLSGHS